VIPRASLVEDRSERWLPVGLVVVPLAMVVGLLAAAGPEGAAAGALLLGAAALVLAGPRIPAVFQVVLVGLLIGYMLLGRGFAYIGVGTAYVGEIAVVLAVAATIVSIGRLRIGVVEALLFAFMAWGAIRTIPYLGAYGPVAIRDAVSWGYALVAIGVMTTLTPSPLTRAVALYRRIIPFALAWFPVMGLLTIVFSGLLPVVPGSTVPIAYFKAGDVGVHLGGIAAFVLMGLYGTGGLREGILWIAWAISGAMVAAVNRGGMFAAATAAVALLFVRELRHWLALTVVALLILIGAWLVDPRIDLGIQRTISFQQLVENVTSVFVDRPDTTTQATKEWRFEWWGTIVNYTLDGPYFWTGKGYGVNLADSDGFQVLDDRSLRSPHSAHFEFLARSGVPGLVLWLTLQAAWAAAMLMAAARARRSGRTWSLAVLAWLFVYWLAAIVNMSVDVYLAGPHGGIWFWAVFGAGLAVARMVRPDVPDPAAQVAAPAREAPTHATVRGA